jgi:hypothetical protein
LNENALIRRKRTVSGTKRTKRAGLTMSVIEGRPEGIDLRPNRPMSDIFIGSAIMHITLPNLGLA